MEKEESVCSPLCEEVKEGMIKLTFDTKTSSKHDESLIEIIVKAKSETDVQHTGEQVWAGSILVGEYLLDQILSRTIQNPSELTIMEVGSGTGVLSILLSFFVKKVIATDYTEELLILERVHDCWGLTF